jgi:hypothetical protein
MELNDGDTMVRITKAGDILYIAVIEEGKFDRAVSRGRKMLDSWNEMNPHDQITTYGERIDLAYMASEVFTDKRALEAPALMILSCAMDSPKIGEAVTAARHDLMAADHKVHMIIERTEEGDFQVCFSCKYIRAEEPKGYQERIWHKDGSVTEGWTRHDR